MSPTVWRGAFHLHSTFSHDGELSIQALASFLRNQGFHFGAMAEHSQDMNADSLRELVSQCDSCSSDQFLLIPGLEFECSGKIHIVGLGVVTLCDSPEPGDVIGHIQKHDGLAILAHPSQQEYPLEPTWLSRLDGCEYWNNRQGKWMPQIHAIRTFRAIQEHAPHLRAFAGIDLHSPDGFSRVSVDIQAPELTKGSLLDALRSSHFRSGGSWVSFPPDGRVSTLKYLWVWLARRVLNGVRRMRDLLRSYTEGADG